MKTEGQSATEKLRCQKKKHSSILLCDWRKFLSETSIRLSVSPDSTGERKKEGKEARKKKERIRPPPMLPVVDMKRRGL